MSLLGPATGLALQTFLACAVVPISWPLWAQQLAEKLECGMTLGEVQRLTREKVLTLEAGPHPWLGNRYIRKGHADLWLRFNEQQSLEWVTLSEMDGWRLMATRQSPRRNLCTGELTYQLRLDWMAELEGAAVFLDGEEVEPEGGKIEVSAGQHEVRIAKPGYEAIVRHLDLGPQDRGDQSLDLGEIELVPLQGE